MRWNSWLYIVLVELISAVLSTAVGLLTNILTNEQHPSVGLKYGLLVFVVSSAALQAARYGIAERKARSADKTLQVVVENTRAILGNQDEANRTQAEHYIDEALEMFPQLHRSWIRAQWQDDDEGVKQVLDALKEPTKSPTDVVLEWQQVRPVWFQTLGWRALLVAGELANSYGASTLSVQLFLAAVTTGSTREQYWRARAALLQKFQDQTQSGLNILFDGRIDGSSQDLFARIVYYFVTDDRLSTQNVLDAWTPGMPIDILMSTNIRIALVFADVDTGTGPTPSQFDRAVAIYRSAVEAVPESASARIGLANVLVSSFAANASTNRHRDLQEALEQAVQARNILRASRANSVQAVEVACQAAYSDMMFNLVIKIGTSVTGEATLEEANSDVVRTLVASAALAKGRTDISDRLIPEVEDPFRKAILFAMAAEVAGHPSDSLWRSALQNARDASERAQALLGLARMGVTELPGIDDVLAVSVSDGALIQAVAAAASGDVGSAIQRLRAMPGADFNAVTALADAYLKASNVAAAVDVLREGARTLSEPRLRVEAARLLWEHDRRDDARVELEALLVDAGSNAALRHDCLAHLGQWAADQKEWATAQQRFEELLALDQSDNEARWAVVLVMLRRGLVAEARRVYDGAPSELAITQSEQARAWMVVRADGQQSDMAQFVERVIDVSQEFPEDEDVQAEAIFTVLAPGEVDREPLPPSTQARFNHLFEGFFERWPDSSRLRRFSASDIQTLVDQMADLVRPTQEEKTLRAEVAERLANNTLPWALLSAMTGRSYSEIVIVRAGGVLPARHIDVAEQQICREAAQAAIDMNVVLDISSAAVLIELGDIHNLLIGQFQRLVASDGERLDAMSAVAFLRRRSTSSWIYDEQNDRGRLVDIASEIADQRYNQATHVLDLIKRCRVVPVAADHLLGELGDLATPSWVSAVRCAAQSGLAFWCDDVALRAVARSVGVAAFSTPALLEVLFERGVLTATQHEAAVRSLIQGLVGDFPLDQIRLSALLARGRAAASPVASIFSRSSAWTDVNNAYQVWTQLLSQAIGIDLNYAYEWLYAAVIGITRLQKSATMRREAVALLLSAAVNLVGARPDAVVRCVVAARSGLSSVGQGGVDEDPLSRAVEMIYATMVKLVGLREATTYVSGIFSGLNPEDRQKVLQVLYG